MSTTEPSTAAAGEALGLADEALDILTKFRETHPTIANYRIEEAHSALTRTVTLLTREITGHDPEQEAALATFRTRLGK